MKHFISIAIDGPAGAGKSTMARAVAKELGYVYVDTGAIYRTVGYYIQLCGIGPRDVDSVTRLIDEVNVELRYPEDGVQHMILNGQDVTDEIRSPEMSDYASKLSTLEVVRDFLLDVQRDMARTHNVVMDGRDIGTVVLPDADVKIYLTASAEVRARWRLAEFQAKGDKKMSYETVLRDIRQRDDRDMNRKIAPLRCAKDAVRLDTSELTIAQSVDAIKEIVEKRLGR